MKNWEKLFVQRVNELTEKYSYKKQKGLMTIQLKRNKTHNESKFITGDLNISNFKINIVSSLLKEHVRKLSQSSLLSNKDKCQTTCVYNKKDELEKIQEEPEDYSNNNLIIIKQNNNSKDEKNSLKLKEESFNNKTFKIKKNINWTSHEDWLLKILSQSKLKNKWKTISKIIGTKSISQCIYRLKKISSKVLTGNTLTNIFNEVKNPNYDIENVKDMIISEYFQKSNLMGIKSKLSSSSISKDSFKKKKNLVKRIDLNQDIGNLGLKNENCQNKNNENVFEKLENKKSSFLELIKMDVEKEEDNESGGKNRIHMLNGKNTESNFLLEKKLSISLDFINKKENETITNKVVNIENIKDEYNNCDLNMDNFDQINLDEFKNSCNLNKEYDVDDDILMNKKLDYSYDNINLYQFDTDLHPFNCYESEIIQSKSNIFKHLKKDTNIKKKMYTEDSFKYTSLLSPKNEMALSKNYKSSNEINVDNLANNLNLIKKYSGAEFDSYRHKEKFTEYIFPDTVDVYFSDDDKFFGQKQSSGTSNSIEKLNTDKLLENEIDKCFFTKSPSLNEDIIEIDNIISSAEFNNLSYEDKISSLNKVIMDLNVLLSDQENIKSNQNFLRIQQKIIDLLISITEYQINSVNN